MAPRYPTSARPGYGTGSSRTTSNQVHTAWPRPQHTAAAASRYHDIFNRPSARRPARTRAGAAIKSGTIVWPRSFTTVIERVLPGAKARYETYRRVPTASAAAATRAVRLGDSSNICIGRASTAPGANLNDPRARLGQP